MTRQDIIAALKGSLPAVCQGMGVVAAYLFGSWATGESRPDSDVDVGVFLREQSADASGWPPAEVTLEDRLATGSKLPVEVHVLNKAPLALSGRVLEEGVLVYSGDEVLRVRTEVAVRGQYMDFKPRLERLHEMRLAAFAEKGLK